MKYLFILTCALFSQFLGLAQTTDVSLLYKNAVGATVTIVTADENGQETGFGSGFFIAKDLIATNFHVIEDAHQAIAIIPDSDVPPIEIKGWMQVDPSNDLAILKANYNMDSPLKLAPEDVKIGDAVYAIGTPQGLPATISNGIVSSFRNVGEDVLYLQITAPISEGSSGGPLLNKNGEVIGISTMTFTEGQNLNFGVSSAYLSVMMQKIAFFSPLPPPKVPSNSAPAEPKGGAVEQPEITVPKRATSPVPFPNVEEYKFKVLQKVKDLGNYIAIIGSKKSSSDRVSQAIELANGLFVPDAQIEVSSKSGTKTNYGVRGYLGRLRNLKYDDVSIEWTNIYYVSELRKAMDGNYYGIVSFEQVFKGYREGRIVYEDRTRKNVEVLVRQLIKGENTVIWDILLSDIGVKETR